MSKGKWNKHGTWIDLCPLRPVDHLKGDCSTRALSYAFDLPYSVMFGLQRRVASRYGLRYNSWKVLNHLFRLFNYRPLPFMGNMDCGSFAEYVKGVGYDYPVVIYSSAHLSIADDGCIVDTWDSRSKRVADAWVRCNDGLRDVLPF